MKGGGEKIKNKYCCLLLSDRLSLFAWFFVFWIWISIPVCLGTADGKPFWLKSHFEDYLDNGKRYHGPFPSFSSFFSVKLIIPASSRNPIVQFPGRHARK